MTIPISKDFDLPADVVGQTQAILAMKGAGKTYAATKMMEGMVRAGFHAVAIDPTGVWWGLTTSADGRGPGVDVIVMGGERGHVPLEPTAGEYVAEFVVDSGRSVVLDLSLMESNAAMYRFMAAFLGRLYHYKAKHRQSLHVFFDEADTAAPQQPGPDQTKVLGAAEACVRRGRSRGLGMTLITQRPAVLNKNLLEMCDTLYVMRVIGSNDQDAIRKRLSVDAEPARVTEVLGTLARLEQGEAYVFSPQALKAFKRIRFDRKDTFDTSRTPEAGKAVVAPKFSADVDLGKLSDQIRATVERAKENDPAALKKKIAELQKQLGEKPVERKVIEKPVVTDSQVKRVETLVDRLTREGDRRIEAGEALKQTGEELKRTAVEFSSALRAASSPSTPLARTSPTVAAKPSPVRLVAPAAVRTGSQSIGGVSPRQKRMLDAAATLTTLGADVNRDTVSAWIGVHPRGGSVGEELKALADAGLIVVDRGSIEVTAVGMNAADQLDPQQAIERARAGLTPRQVRIFDIVTAAHPNGISRDAVAEQMGIHPRGGSFGEDIARLVNRGLIENARGEMRARDFLFAV